jgi:hypothetical protein
MSASSSNEAVIVAENDPDMRGIVRVDNGTISSGKRATLPEHRLDYAALTPATKVLTSRSTALRPRCCWTYPGFMAARRRVTSAMFSASMTWAGSSRLRHWGLLEPK